MICGALGARGVAFAREDLTVFALAPATAVGCAEGWALAIVASGRTVSPRCVA